MANVPNIRIEPADVPDAVAGAPFIDPAVLAARTIVRGADGTHYDVVAVVSEGRLLARHPATRALSVAQVKGSTKGEEIPVQLIPLAEDTTADVPKGTLKASGERTDGIAWRAGLEQIRAVNQG